ncbi:MAG TPA: MFS transporter [Polyangiaceae bacterium]|nr:MFS transporter [Polyangiaceae bacterium]
MSEQRDRRVAWGVTWLAYATYYTGRKGFSAAKSSISRELGVSERMLGAIDAVYLTTYALGQFANGLLGDRIGARRLIGYGMLLSAGCCVAFGSVSSAAMFLICFAVNGYAQSSGWPGTTRAMAEWTTPRNRGTVMAFWATCYQVGGIAASVIAGWLLVRYGWRSAFWVPAIIIAGVAVLVLLFLKIPPRSAARAGAFLPGSSTAPAALLSPDSVSSEASLRKAAQRAVLRNPLLWFYAASYFFIKFIRYALLFWLPYYLTKRLGYAEDHAAYASTAFEAGGIAGVIAIGILSDRIARFSRSLLAATWLGALALLLLLYGWYAAHGMLTNVLILALVGAALFGPDSLISGAAAQDAGGRHAAATATGFVNGVGSIGGILEGFAVPWLTQRFGWDALFPVLVGLAVCAVLALLPALRRAPREGLVA